MSVNIADSPLKGLLGGPKKTFRGGIGKKVFSQVPRAQSLNSSYFRLILSWPPKLQQDGSSSGDKTFLLVKHNGSNGQIWG